MVDDSVTTEDKIKLTVHRLRSNHSRGPYVIISENLQQWLREERETDAAEATAADTRARKTTKVEVETETTETEM